MSKIKVNEIEKASGSGITIPTGSTFTVTDGIAASTLTGTVAQANIADQAINEAKMQISNAPTNGYFLSAQSGNTGGLTWAEAGGGGKVLQVVNVSSNTNAATSNTAWTDTGISLAITPSATSSKVMVMVNGTIAGKATTYSAGCAVMRGTTPIGGGSAGRYADGACVDQWQGTANDYHKSHWSFNFLDTPNTTSATTYKIVFASGYASGDGGYAYFNRNQADDDHFDDLATITLMEIGA